MVLFPAVPVQRTEQPAVQQIVRELERLAKGLGGFPLGSGGTRGAEAAKAIVASLKKINATLGEGAQRGELGKSGFDTIGREFEKIGATLRALGSTPKPTAKTTARKATKRTTRR